LQFLEVPYCCVLDFINHCLYDSGKVYGKEKTLGKYEERSMICQICGKHGASMLVRQIIDGKAKELYLCRACAKKHHLYSDDRKMHLSLKAIFDGLLPQKGGSGEAAESVRPVVCPDCGTPLSRVKEKKMLGCPRCFFYFRDTVVKLMQESSGEVFYAGRLPAQLETFSETAFSLHRLEEELQKAVENEEYELAAYLRDKIKEQEVST